MAISKIHGQMLRNNLLRDGEAAAIDTDLLYLDVLSRRVGINTVFPDYELSVNGTLGVGEFVVTGNTVGTLNGDIELSPHVGNNVKVNSGTPSTLAYFDTSLNLVGSPNLTFDGSSLVFNGTFKVGTVSISGDTITADNGLNLTSNNGGNINLTPDTGGSVNISNLSLTGLTPNRVSVTSSTGSLTQSPIFRFDESLTRLELDGTAIVTDLESVTSKIGNSTFAGNTWEIVDPLFLISPDYFTGIVKINSATGLGLPAGNDAQRPVNPPVGTTRFNTESYTVELWEGSNWINIGPNLFTVQSQTIVPDGSSTVFDLDRPVLAEENIIVSINGIIQIPVQAYLVSWATIQFSEPLYPSDTIEIRYIIASESFGVLLENPEVDGGVF